MPEATLLRSSQMASFVARGFLRFDAAVPESINRQFLDEAGSPAAAEGEKLARTYGRMLAESAIPAVPAGVPLADAYPEGSALARLLALPLVGGAIESLVGPRCRFDHHFLHVTFPDGFGGTGTRNVSQRTHQDSTLDFRRAFDVQVMYFPHEVTREMGGTRFVPGTHLRKVSESAVARYQNMLGQQHVVCPAGTLFFMHHGMWHGAGVNRSTRVRYMFKLRLNPSVRQVRLWDASDLPNDSKQRPIFFVKEPPDPEDLHTILTRPEPWFEVDTGRLEYVNRIKLWRQLLGDESFDADYWLTRLENEPV